MILDQDNMISLQLFQVCHIMIFQFRNWEKANFNKDDFFLFSFIFFHFIFYYYYLFDRHIKINFQIINLPIHCCNHLKIMFRSFSSFQDPP